MESTTTVLFRTLISLMLLSWLPVYAAADASFIGTHFSGSGQCATCHDGLIAPDGKDVSIVKSWSTSMMANSTRDPYWLAKVASEVHRNPALSDQLNDTCSRCHAPMANESARKAADPLILLDGPLAGDGFLDPLNPYFDHAMDGVSCTACHQIADTAVLGTLPGFSGNFTINSYLNPVERPAYGQFALPVSQPMKNQVSFTPQQSTHISQSSLCASCHNLKTPFVDQNGDLASTTPESEFPEQMVYSEWDNSDFRDGGSQARSCQSCHMPLVPGAMKIANRPGSVTARTGFSEHSFVGANTVMMDMLNQNAAALGVTASSADFDQSIARSRAFLQTAASVEILSAELLAGNLTVVLKVNNLSGHKLPSAYPSRRVYIHFRAQDDNGQVLFESGKTNTDGSIVGVAEDSDSSTYEPHYQQITQANQVQVYEPIMENSQGAVTHTLIRAAAYIKDNRLTPTGFDKTTAPPDVAVKGAATLDSDFTGGSDTITYTVNVGDQPYISIDVALKYQTLSFGHLQDLFTDAASVTEVAEFKTYFEASTLRAETLATAHTSLGVSRGQFYVIPATNGKSVIFGL